MSTQDPPWKPRGLLGRLRRSVFTDPVYPDTSRQRRRIAFDNLILHLHPPTVPERTLRFTLTWGLGGMSLVLTLLLGLTGLLLMFVYEPTPEGAYESILALQREVGFGQLVRNIHHWSANVLVIVALLHLLRVFFTGAWHGPRQFNWIIGLGLLLLVLTANFTGYLLPWDQLAFWAVTVCTSMAEYVPVIGGWLQETMRGGKEVGPATLLVFFTIHTTIVPFLLVILLPFHFWRVRKAGGLVLQRAPGEEPEEKTKYVPTIPNLVVKEAAVALVLIAAILVFATLFDAPLEGKANAGMSPNPAKAPWYFLGIQELLLHFHPLFAVCAVPLLAAGALLSLPYLQYGEPVAGVWFVSARGRRLSVMAAATALVITPLIVVGDEILPDVSTRLSGGSAAAVGVLLPAVLLAGAVAGSYVFMKRRYEATKCEAIQAITVFFLGALVLLTVCGIWFRGPGMALSWPWR